MTDARQPRSPKLQYMTERRRRRSLESCSCPLIPRDICTVHCHLTHDQLALLETGRLSESFLQPAIHAANTYPAYRRAALQPAPTRGGPDAANTRVRVSHRIFPTRPLPLYSQRRVSYLVPSRRQGSRGCTAPPSERQARSRVRTLLPKITAGWRRAGLTGGAVRMNCRNRSDARRAWSLAVENTMDARGRGRLARASWLVLWRLRVGTWILGRSRTRKLG